MEKVRGQCLICEQQVNRNAQDGVEVQSKLEVFFVLRKVVEVPDSLLLNFLEGTTMTSVDLCECCQGTVKQCREVHEQLSKLQRKWNESKVMIMNSIKHSMWMPSPEEGHSVDLETRRCAVSQMSMFPPEPWRSGGMMKSKPKITAGGHQPSSSTVTFSGEEGGNAPFPIRKETTPEEERPATNQQQQGIPRERSHPCPRCPKKYVNPLLLQKHLLAHPEVGGTRGTETSKPLLFKCGDCGKQFSRKGNLQTHQLIHRGEKPHECQLCNQRFTQQVGLHTHMNSHLGEKHFKCEICGKAFVTKRELIDHRTVHTGEKPWKCNLCPQAYRRYSQLSTHKKIHKTKQAPANIIIQQTKKCRVDPF